METFEIDLDSECVWLDDAWLTRDDLVRKIREMIDAGELMLARPSQALEALTRALAQARLLALRIPAEMSDALNALSQQTGRPVGALAREALAAYLAVSGQPLAPEGAGTAPDSGASPSAASSRDRVDPIPLIARASEQPGERTGRK